MPAAATAAATMTLIETMAVPFGVVAGWLLVLSLLELLGGPVSAAVPVVGELGAHHPAGGGVHLDHGVGAVLVPEGHLVPEAGRPAGHVDDVAGRDLGSGRLRLTLGQPRGGGRPGRRRRDRGGHDPGGLHLVGSRGGPEDRGGEADAQPDGDGEGGPEGRPGGCRGTQHLGSPFWSGSPGPDDPVIACKNDRSPRV